MLTRVDDLVSSGDGRHRGPFRFDLGPITRHLGLPERIYRIKAVVRRVPEAKLGLCKILFLIKLFLNHNLS